MLGLLGVRPNDEIHELFVASDGLEKLCEKAGLYYVGYQRWEGGSALSEQRQRRDTIAS